MDASSVSPTPVCRHSPVHETQDTDTVSVQDTVCEMCGAVADDPIMMIRCHAANLHAALGLVSSPVQRNPLWRPNHSIQAFQEAIFQKACSIAGISYTGHAVVKSFLGNQAEYYGGILARLGDSKCRDITDALKQMFVARQPVPGSWVAWSLDIKAANHNPIGEIFIIRTGSVVDPLAELQADGAFMP